MPMTNRTNRFLVTRGVHLVPFLSQPFLQSCRTVLRWFMPAKFPTPALQEQLPIVLEFRRVTHALVALLGEWRAQTQVLLGRLSMLYRVG